MIKLRYNFSNEIVEILKNLNNFIKIESLCENEEQLKMEFFKNMVYHYW